MMPTTRRDPDVVRSTVPEGKLTWLGRLGGHDYASYQGREYIVDAYPSNPEDFSRTPGQLFIMRIRHELIDGSAYEHHATHRALPVPDGTYASLLAKVRKPDTEPPMRTWDVLATLPLMQRREPLRIPTAPASSITVGALKAQLGPVGPLPVIEVGGNQPPERSPAGIVAYLGSRGIELSLARGRLLARARKPIRAEDRYLIERTEELIVGVLSGSPVACSLCAEPAVSIAVPRAPMCAAHLEG
jgi:hypothetical protein